MDKVNKFFEFDDDIAAEIEPDVIIPKRRKLVAKSETKIKTKTLFDHIKAITEAEYDPDYFENMSTGDKKTFSIFMINRYLSMNPEWIWLVNQFQQYTQYITPEIAYRFYANMIPKGKIFLKYVKGGKDPYKKELVEIIASYYESSILIAKEYLDILYVIPNGVDKVREICAMYGRDEKEIKKLIKI